MNKILLPLLLLFTSSLFSQSNVRIPNNTLDTFDLSGNENKSIYGLLDNNLTTGLNLNGVDEFDYILPWRSVVVLPGLYSNMKIRLYAEAGSTGGYTIEFYNEAKALLGSTYAPKSGYMEWLTFNVNTYSNVRYVHIYITNSTDFNAGFKEMELYGDLVGSAANIYPTTPVVTKPDLGYKAYGVCALDYPFASDPDSTKVVNKLSYWGRTGYEGTRTDHYPETYYPNPLLNAAINLSRFGYNHISLSLQWLRDNDYKLQYYQNGGNIKYYDMATAAATNNQYVTNVVSDRKYIEPASDSTLATTWFPAGELYGNMAALYGRNTSATLTSTVTGGVTTTGQDGITYMEVGNELNRNFSGPAAYHSPLVYYRYISAAYPRIKAADPSMQVFCAALTYANLSYWRAMYFIHFWENSAATPFPTDGFNMNQYFPRDSPGSTAYGQTAEGYGLYGKLMAVKTTFDKIYPNKLFTYSEYGIAGNAENSPYSVDAIGSKTSLQVAADASLRIEAVTQTVPFVDRNSYYAYFADGTYPFNSMACTKKFFNGPSGAYSGMVIYPVGYALATRYTLEKQYKFHSTILVYGGNTGYWLTKKSHVSDSSKKIFKVWMGTLSGATAAVSIPVGATATSARKYTTPYSSFDTTSTPLTITGGNVSVTANEGVQWVVVDYATSVAPKYIKRPGVRTVFKLGTP